MGPSAIWIRMLVGVGGAAIAASPFLPWSEAGGVERTGWDAAAGPAALVLLAGLVAVVFAATGGAFGLFRPDVSVRGAADILGVVSSVVMACVVLFDLPDPAYGAFVGLFAAIAVACASADYRVLSGAPAFPSLESRGG